MWYVASPSEPLPSLFKLYPWGQKWPGPASHMFYLGLYRENMKKSSCLKPLGLLLLQWATEVTHHYFRAYIFWQKCWNQTFSMIIYSLIFICLMTSKNYRNHSCESFWYVKGNFDKKCMCNLNVYIFYLCFVPGIIHGDCCDRKTPKTIVLFKYNPFFLLMNLVTPLLFVEMLVLTSY